MNESRPSDFRPTATLETLRHRSALLSGIRRFFEDAGYFEVQTPVLSADTVVDAWLDPFTVPTAREPNRPQFLQTSPELGMKRLLAAGADRIYQMGPVFRRDEQGTLHNPEFTLLEWYRVDDDDAAQMTFTERLVRHVLEQANAVVETDARMDLIGDNCFERITYTDAFRRVLGIDPLTCSTDELRRIASEQAEKIPDSLPPEDRDGWLDVLLINRIEPELFPGSALFLNDYPPSQAALARCRPRDDSANAPEVAARFELFLDGIEICNGYHELTDADVLRARQRHQQEIRRQYGLSTLPETNRLLEAMESGLPDSSGVALGIDRLIMLALGKDTIADVIPFPWDRA